MAENGMLQRAYSVCSETVHICSFDEVFHCLYTGHYAVYFNNLVNISLPEVQ